MKKVVAILLMLLLFGCSSEAIDFTVERVSPYQAAEAITIVIQAEKNGTAIADLELSGQLEMAKMDHGTIEVVFTNQGDGMYEGEVELPMGGEWIIDLTAEMDGKTYEELLTFDVNEG
ncbi:hypothetical protein DX933_08790 [Ornithinibacillus gellani]|uniref:FixH family protein n=1 Tax=Ornithinibacillus gellani TaxID=2293253 RepID=UPI000F47DE96|nr:FixH family protein [Ornithinibacillus gellani]TQS74857.1 hypothetical protein DX933_08790 [Ornithinibacillus gellani]